MEKGTRFVGLDVHKASIAVAVGGSSGDPEDHGQIAERPGGDPQAAGPPWGRTPG